jgi:GDPmannose 4,6-dehydratase
MSDYIVIDGCMGQDGSYLAKYLLDAGEKIIGVTRRSGSSTSWRHDELKITGKFKIEYCDITEPHSVDSLIKKYKPKEYYHLAAQSFVKDSFDNPYCTVNTNAIGTMNILESIKNFSPETRMYNSSTSEMFGRVLEVPQSEKTPFNPVSPYGVAKLFAHEMIKVYRESYGLYACSGELFNHESRLRGKEFVTKKITHGLVNWVRTKEPVILGNLDAKRDWGHASDYVKAQVLMLRQERPVDYVIASGQMITIRDFIIKCLKVLNVNYKIENQGTVNEIITDDQNNTIVKVSEEFYRPNEVNELLGDCSKAEKELGWKREYTIDTLIEDMIDFEWSN